MRGSLAVWVVGAAAFVSVFSNEARGADVVASEPCDIGISGVLQPGDSAAFRSLMKAGGCTYSTLRLDSPGGSLSEALAIARGFTRTRTVIDDGAQCLSACALLFMAGRMCAGSPYFCSPTRAMHKNAVLGFHAPFLQTSGEQQFVPLDVSFSEAVEVFAEILDTVARLSAEVRQTGYDKDIVPGDLLSKMFITPPQAFYYVENNDQFYSWDIAILDDDVRPGGPALTEEQVRILCYSLVFSEMRGWSYTPYGFDGYRAGLDELADVAGPVEVRPFDSSFLPEGSRVVDPKEYLMRFEYLNMGPSVSGLCRVAPDMWGERAGYFEVSFRGDYGGLDPAMETEGVLSGSIVTRLSFNANMHYSMAFPPGTPVRDLVLR